MKTNQKQAVDEKVQNLLLTFLVKSLSLQNEEEKLREAVDTCVKVRQTFMCNIKSFIYLIYTIYCSMHEAVDCICQNTRQPCI
jgi:hypothetical protein